jgi:hypothetical protein
LRQGAAAIFAIVPHPPAAMSAWRAAHAKIAAHWRIRCQPCWKSDFWNSSRPAPSGQAGIASHIPHSRFQKEPPMDAERINQIGNTLSELGARTEDLRRYL